MKIVKVFLQKAADFEDSLLAQLQLRTKQMSAVQAYVIIGNYSTTCPMPSLPMVISVP